jgi:hypothetical protein
MNCSVCSHPDHQAIDQALITGAATLAALSKQYNLSTSALDRHKAHLQAKVGRAKGRLQDNLLQSCLFWLVQALEMSMQTAAAAQAEGNHRIVLQALAQGARLLKVLLKQDLPLDDRLVFDLLTSPQWTAENGFLPHDSQILAAGRGALAGEFTAACPDTEPPPSTDFSPADLDLVQHLLSDLASPTVPPAPIAKREKSGKLPGKITAKNHNKQKKQADKLNNKFAGMNWSCLSGQAPLGPPKSKFEAALREIDELGPIPTDIPLSAYLHEQSLRGNQVGQKSAR